MSREGGLKVCKHKGLLLTAAIMLSEISNACACAHAIKPQPQSINNFYDRDYYGRLGVQADARNLYIVDQYRCYDMTFLSNRNLTLFFNNASDSDFEPTYVGALIVRSFRGTPTDGSPYDVFFYRNAINEQKGPSKWAKPTSSSIEQVNRGDILNGKDVVVVSDTYDPDAAVSVTSAQELFRLLKSGTGSHVNPIQDWHALVVSPADQGYRVDRNSSQARAEWSIDPETMKGDKPSYYLVRNYLIKYQNSPSPAPDPFFQIGAQGASCVYLKLIAPGDQQSRFAVQGGVNNGFATFQMISNANCYE